MLTLVIWGEADLDRHSWVMLGVRRGDSWCGISHGAAGPADLPKLENPEAVLGLFGELVTAAAGSPVARLARYGVFRSSSTQGAVFLVGDVGHEARARSV